MSVDYYTCDKCGHGFRDDSDDYRHCKCGYCFCSAECGKLENIQEKYDEKTDSYAVDKNIPITCIFCRKESYTTSDLFNALVAHYNLSPEDVVKIWKEQNNGR
jgi:hypothetical protein